MLGSWVRQAMLPVGKVLEAGVEVFAPGSEAGTEGRNGAVVAEAGLKAGAHWDLASPRAGIESRGSPTSG